MFGVKVFLAATLAAAALVGATTAHSASRPLITGVTDPETFGGTDARVAFARTRGAGATSVRLTLEWRAVAPTPLANRPPHGFHPTDHEDPLYSWGGFDAQVRWAVEAGLEPLVTITGAPRWAEDAVPGTNGLRRANPQAYAAFTRAATERYDGTFEREGTDEPLPRVRWWHAWNEPNHANRSLLKHGQADWYRALVNAFAGPVHRAAPGNLVVAGGTSPFTTETSVGPLFFMRQLLCVKSAAPPRSSCNRTVAFDVWSHHPYTSGGPLHHANGNDDVSLGDLPEMRRLLQAAQRLGHIRSARGVRFWVTEFSWDTAPPDPKAMPLALQTRWTAEALYRMWKNGVDLVIWFRIRDDPLATSFYQSGLFFRGATMQRDRPKSTLYAFRFPFVAFTEPSGLFVWGRTPAGRPGPVVIEQRFSGGWNRLGTRTADANGIFTARLNGAAQGSVRARLGTDNSVPFSLSVPPDRFYYPFGS